MNKKVFVYKKETSGYLNITDGGLKKNSTFLGDKIKTIKNEEKNNYIGIINDNKEIEIDLSKLETGKTYTIVYNNEIMEEITKFDN